MTGCDGAISHLSQKKVEELDSEPFDGEQRGWVNLEVSCWRLVNARCGLRGVRVVASVAQWTESGCPVWDEESTDTWSRGLPKLSLWRISHCLMQVSSVRRRFLPLERFFVAGREFADPGVALVSLDVLDALEADLEAMFAVVGLHLGQQCGRGLSDRFFGASAEQVCLSGSH